ncbi:UDP-glucose dehydrogenase family protein [Nocardia alni]|uniref:UDP-glucose dehydrogenase family protein n=1 Tax=Nocardia alni TaxID=2815723 RepID=UPI001C2102B0|nr:UDP-glucose/GDP-mannose dehydrogenase family protein [Nocardia alni]
MSIAGHIAVLGAGYVGLTTGACLSSLGHTVTCIDHDRALVDSLRTGHTSLAEPDLPGLLRHSLAAETLRFDTDIGSALTCANTVIVCLPTPSQPDGAADLTTIDDAVDRIKHHTRPGTVVIIKSTVPVGTCARIAKEIECGDIAVVSNPEFLREGHTVYDFLHPARIVIGSHDPAAAKSVANLYEALRTEVIFTDPASAELAKYAANAFLATKLSFVNDIATLCDTLAADITDITHILGADPRIGSDYLRPGPGWGGPCLPKDTTALAHQARTVGIALPVVDAAIEANIARQQHIISRVLSELGEQNPLRIGILGLTFKVGTNDHRHSPAIDIAQALARHGARITACDPTVETSADRINSTPDPYDVAHGAHALLLLTDWDEYRRLDWRRIATAMTGRIVFDTRNFLDPNELRDAGLHHIALGSSRVGPA